MRYETVNLIGESYDDDCSINSAEGPSYAPLLQEKDSNLAGLEAGDETSANSPRKQFHKTYSDL